MSAPQRRTDENKRLKQRADYFFSASARSRDEVARFAAELLEIGPTVAIGGFLRDLFLSGNRDFRSDVDFVVDPVSMAEFDRFADRLQARRNRFGGYSIDLSRWKVDVWPLERTWVAVHGHASVDRLADLVNATFFDWDAVLYDVRTHNLVASDSYFDRIRNRVLDINVAPNPNPLGNAVRAIRYAYRWDATFGPRLAEHVARQIADHGWGALLDSEKAGFSHKILPLLDGEAIFEAVRHCADGNDEAVRVSLRPVQHEFPFSDFEPQRTRLREQAA